MEDHLLFSECKEAGKAAENAKKSNKAGRQGTGLVHIYCGDGKGKTTAGMGLCLRAAGFGYRVLICQFMKDTHSSERRALSFVPGITLMDGADKVKFSFCMTPEEKAEEKIRCKARLDEAFRLAREEGYDLLFLDEVIYSIRSGFVDEEDVLLHLENKPDKLEVVMTGQDPGEKLIERADYVSEIRKVKHPFDHNQAARDGIER